MLSTRMTGMFFAGLASCVLGTASARAQATFPDVPPEHPHFDAAEYMYDFEFIDTFADGYFRPDEPITRDAFARMFPFPDLADKIRMESCDLAGCSHRTTDTVTFAEASKILTETFISYYKPFDGPWYAQYVVAIAQQKAIPIGILHFDQPVTRGQIAEMIYRFLASVHSKDSLSYESIVEQEEILARTDLAEADIVFVGDSLTQQWQTTGRKSWRSLLEVLEPSHVQNLAIGGDTVNRLTWRIAHGHEFEQVSPQLFVVLVGTIDLEKKEPEEVSEGVLGIVTQLRQGWPDAKVLLVGILPRIESTDRMMRKIEQTNHLLRRGIADEKVTFIDVNDDILAPDEAMISGDGVHLLPAGYEVYTAAILPTLTDMLAHEPSRWTRWRRHIGRAFSSLLDILTIPLTWVGL